MTIATDHYLAQADECARQAELCESDNIRQRYITAEAAWRNMAKLFLDPPAGARPTPRYA